MSKAWKLFIVNALFFGIFFLGFIEESTIPSWKIQYSALGYIFIFSLIPYIVLYGIFSFLYTRKIILPNVQLFLFVVVFFYGGMLIPFHFLSSSLSKVKETWMLFAAIMGVSLGFGLLTKGIYYITNKIKTNRKLKQSNKFS